MNANNYHNNQLQHNQKHQYHHEDSQQHYYTQQHEHHGGHQQQRGYGVINGGSERSPMPHDGHSHNNRHYDSHSMTTSNVMSTTGPNTPASPASNLIQNEQMIVKQSSSEKLEKKNKKDKGPGKDEYLVRVAAFVSDVMLENIKQQIAEAEQQPHNIEEKGSSKETASNNDKNKTAQEIVIEVVDKQSNNNSPTTTEQEAGSEDKKRESLSEISSSLPDSSSLIDTAKLETGLESQEMQDFKAQQLEANETTADELGMEEKVDVGSETNKETNAVPSADQEQVEENTFEQCTATRI